jgi:hypothetical protein
MALADSKGLCGSAMPIRIKSIRWISPGASTQTTNPLPHAGLVEMAGKEVRALRFGQKLGAIVQFRAFKGRRESLALTATGKVRQQTGQECPNPLAGILGQCRRALSRRQA